MGKVNLFKNSTYMAYISPTFKVKIMSMVEPTVIITVSASCCGLTYSLVSKRGALAFLERCNTINYYLFKVVANSHGQYGVIGTGL